MANNRDITLTVEVKEKGDGAKRAAKDLEGVDKAAAGAAGSMKDANIEASKFEKSLDEVAANVETLDQSMDSATRSVRTHEQQMALMRAEYQKTADEITRLNAELLNTNTSGGRGGIRKSIQEQQRYLADLRKIAKEFQNASGIKFTLGGGEPVMSGVLEGILGGLPQMGGVPPQVLAGGAAIGLAIAPPIAAAVSGAVLGTVGAGGVIGGALLATKDPAVKSAFVDFGHFVMEQLEPAGRAFKTPVLDALAELKTDVAGAGLGNVLSAAAPLTGPFTKGVTGFATEITDSLGKAFDRAGPLFDLWEKEMPEMGDAIGDSLDAVSATSAASARGLGAFFNTLEIGTRAMGDATAGLIAINDVLSATSMGLLDMSADSDTWGGLLFGWVGMVGTAIRQLSPEVVGVGQRMSNAGDDADNLADGLQSVEVEAYDARDALKAMNDIQLGQISNQVAFEQSLDDLAESLKENGRSLDINGQKGRDNMSAFTSAVGDAKKARDDLLAQGKIEEANAAYQRMVARIRDVMIQAGFTKAEINKLLGPFEIQIGVTYKERNRPSFITSSLSEPARDIARRASGGPVTAGEPYIVGDGGRPELFVPGQNGYIMSSVPSAGAMAGAATGNPRPVAIYGGGLGELVFEWLREQIASRGGHLAVLGLRT